MCVPPRRHHPPCGTSPISRFESNAQAKRSDGRSVGRSSGRSRGGLSARARRARRALCALRHSRHSRRDARLWRCGFHQQQISNLKIRPPLSPEGAERAPSVDGMSRGKRLGTPRRHMTTWRYRLPVLRFWVHCAYSHTPTAWVAKTPSCRRRPTKPKTENWPGPGRKLGRGPAKYTTTTTLSSQQQQQQPKQAAPASPLNARLASRIVSRNRIADPPW